MFLFLVLFKLYDADSAFLRWADEMSLALLYIYTNL